ncbi:MAG: twin-arginine translocase TatA/TatE family subunit [Sphingomonadales bacterium]|nr:twin-arginine translocase TatA/TatE family subunit [Sphingomonadales bacterium]
MGSFSALHWIIVVLVVVLLFGGGRISGLMGDVAKGIKSFKKGLADDEDEAASSAKPAQRLEQARPAASEQSAARDEQKLNS